jgi:hypothetical protein
VYCRGPFTGYAWAPVAADQPMVEMETGPTDMQYFPNVAGQACGLTAQGVTHCTVEGGGLAPFAPAAAYTFVDLAGSGYRLGSHIFGSQMCGLTGGGQVACWYRGSTQAGLVAGGMTFATPGTLAAASPDRARRRPRTTPPHEPVRRSLPRCD